MAVPVATPHPGFTASWTDAIRRRPVAAFLALVYAISWTLFLPPLLSETGLGVLPVPIPPQPSLLLVTLLGLALPGYLVTRIADGPTGVATLRRRYLRWRVGLGWYLLAVFGPAAAVLVGATLWLGPEPLRRLAGDWGVLFAGYLPQAALLALLINLWEEGGWTGFLLPRLQERHGPPTASVLVTFAQAFVHVPLIFIVGGVSDERIAAGDIWLYLVLLFVLPIPVRVLWSGLWNGTGGSLLVVALCHAAFNATTGAAFTPQIVPGRDPIWVYAVYAALALALIALTRGRLGYRPDRSG